MTERVRSHRALWLLASMLWVSNACGDGGEEPDQAPEDSPTEKEGRSVSGEKTAQGPAWHQDVAPIVVPKCTGCHQTGSIAPFSLLTYADAKPFASARHVASTTWSEVVRSCSAVKWISHTNA